MDPSAASSRHSLVYTLSFALALTSSGCKKHGTEAKQAAPQAAAQSAAPVTPQPAAAASPAPVPVQVPLETDPLYQQALQLASTDLRKAMAVLEAEIAKAPDAPQSAPYYLLLGKLKKRYEEACANGNQPPPGQPVQPCSDFREYAQSRPTEFFGDEPSGSYLYTGIHFTEVQKRFPSSAFAVDAAYETTNLAQGGECEGQLVCYIESGFAPMQKFLQNYPDSPHTEQALQRADDAFRKTLWGDRWKTDWTEVTDPNKATNFYDPADLKRLVQEYEDLAEKLPPRFRARPWETVAYYRNRFGETDRARALYQKIVLQFPDYENISEARRNLAALTR
jgi:tetratricopeptide (TPR) repeat protein